WGFGPLLFFPYGTMANEFAYCCAIAFLLLTAALNYSVYLPTFVVIFVSFSLPSVTTVALQRGAEHLALAGSLAVFVVMMLRVGRTFNRSFVKSLELRFENVSLVHQLVAQKNEAVAANQAKSRFLATAS